jgi:hypothetical protein
MAENVLDRQFQAEAIRCLKRYMAREVFYIIQRRQRETNASKIVI